MSTPVIQLKNLVKTYYLGNTLVRALDGVNLEILRGEMVAIMGPSGSGKSTMMNILGCLDRPDSGSYFLDQEDVSRLSKNHLSEIRSRKIGFVFQSFNLLPRISAWENVELPLLYANIKNSKKLAKAALEMTGLGDRIKHEPNQLSGGQRQRVAIARAIVTNPAMILADEPTGNLDSKTSEEILALFKKLHDEGRTIIMVTHEPDVAGFCQRKIFLKDGRVLTE